MKIIHILNVADLAFMAAGVGVALLMIIVGGRDDRRREAGSSSSERTKPDARV